MICKHIDECSFFTGYLIDKPQKAQEVMDHYCKNDFESCARNRLAKVIGIENVPETLFPDMKGVADQLIGIADKERRLRTAESNSLISAIEAEDIFDFALDLISDSSQLVMNQSYKVKDQKLRRFSMWLNDELQNYYAKIIQLKIKQTGVRSRKRGKNPLTMFLENLRRNKLNHEVLLKKAETREDVCAIHFSSMATRIALFNGLKGKTLPRDVLTAINTVLEVEEKQFKLGSAAISKRYDYNISK